MNNSIRAMLGKYTIRNDSERKNAMKEIIQEIALAGLSRAGFFKEAAFYGGTALRIFYGLDRFSEDLDFSLLVRNDDFSFKKYFSFLENEMNSFGIHVVFEEKIKTKDSAIRSAFLKGSTKEHLLLFYTDEYSVEVGSEKELIKIKFEVDTNPPDFANFERKYSLLPVPYDVNIYDLSSLFAGKIHAILFRKWKNRIKGRDLYDYVFYLARGSKYNHWHLCERMYQSGVKEAKTYNVEDIKSLLRNHFDIIDYDDAKRDVEPFIKDRSVLELWSPDFFKSITDQLQEYDGI